MAGLEMNLREGIADAADAEFSEAAGEQHGIVASIVLRVGNERLKEDDQSETADSQHAGAILQEMAARLHVRIRWA
jgi:hypothetical protein